MIFSRYPADSPLVSRRRGHFSTTAAPSVDNLKKHTTLGRRRSLSLDDLGFKNNYNIDNEMTTTPDMSLSNICDTEDDLSDFPEEESFNPLLNKDDDREEVLSGSAISGHTTGSGTTEPEVGSLSTIRESSPVEQRSAEEWSPTPNEDEQNEFPKKKNNSLDSVPVHRQTLNNSASNTSIPRSQSHPIGFVHNYLAKWKNKIKK